MVVKKKCVLTAVGSTPPYDAFPCAAVLDAKLGPRPPSRRARKQRPRPSILQRVPVDH